MDRVDVESIVRSLDSIDADDCEEAHNLADNLLLQAVPAEIAAAYQRVVERAEWWAWA